MPIENLRKKALQIRRDALWSIYHAGSGHPGGVLSCADIIACLTSHIGLNKSKTWKNPLILSKGHSVPILYAAAAYDGFLPRQELKTLRQLDSRLQGHPDVSTLPWLGVSTGSLGQGFSYASGLAKGFLMQKNVKNVYAILGDGELQEGQIWETAMFSAHHHLSNLCAIIDYNKLQSDATNAEICGLEPLADKWLAFGWHVQTIDGHAISEIKDALTKFESCCNKPSIIIANTIKGKGVNFMENQPLWHGSVTMTIEQISQTLVALGCNSETLETYLHE